MTNISRLQCRAARSLLDWRQDELEAASNVAKKTIADFERGARNPRPTNLEAIKIAFETAGIEFIPENGGGVGVRMKK